MDGGGCNVSAEIQQDWFGRVQVPGTRTGRVQGTYNTEVCKRYMYGSSDVLS